MRGRNNAFAVALALLGALLARPAWGADNAIQPSREIVLPLRTSGCPLLDVAQVQRIAGVELRDRLASGKDGGGVRANPVQVVCHEGVASMVATDIAGNRRQSDVDLRTTSPVAQPRVLALALAEFLSAENLYQVAAPSKPSPPMVTASAPEKSDEFNPTLVSLLAGPRGWPSFGFTWGLGASVSVPCGTWCLFRADGLVEWGGKNLPQGHASLRTTSAGLAALWGLRRAQNHWAIGPGIRVGHGIMSGQPRDKGAYALGRVSGLWGGPVVSGLFQNTSFLPVALTLSAELGYTLNALRGTSAGKEVSALRDLWFGLVLGVGFAI